MCIENGSEVSYERAGMGMALRYHTGLVLPESTLHCENKGCQSLFLIVNRSLGLLFVSEAVVFLQISFQMTHCVTNDGT